MNTENRSLTSSSYDDFTIIGVVNQLWQGKRTIITVSIGFLMLGILYLLFAKQQWTSEAVVGRATAGQLANYNAAQNVIFSLMPGDKTPIPALQDILFNRFNGAMSSLSISLKKKREPLKLNVTPLVSGSNDPLRISFTATSAKEAQTKLQEYIDQVNNTLVYTSKDDISSSLSVKKKELNDILVSLIKVAQDKKDQRLKVLAEALKVAKAANIGSPQIQFADNLSDDSLFLLGTPALASMIANENTRPLSFDSNYYNIQGALISLQNYKEDISGLSSFRFIQKPDLPELRDSPKRSVVIVLALFIGLVFGSVIVFLRDSNK